ncbi:Enamine/imine deaminase [Pseudovibrio sp. W64]|jgi:enamine deaminase RidA (YjgF/YER057c/UK114 family)|uniref:Enamine deaminase RidA, house cleaning of reactive enamine intermediates, YjgF/YER057c/UK114 family n=1 Tax=Pseudovibrio ascidiaceicola TaxID=285279 RepID=A0A1I4D2I3_9HYPH|nr:MULTISPECIES: RidA family protein [Pseudovibrio]KZK80216.1 Enamine/imine deaminase [Pseudovibrio sp. W64]KZK96692.1 Enamine/imine deaminase [Pseudovibrio sp. Ad5]SFK86939.1 Enamine deaminase RidA, house cleaning of reactive enamine intermediates, YjgF/YER057c/UK114 family [Pseudovibrio ascidiaceicola]
MTTQQALFKFLQPEGWKPASGYANGIMAEGTPIFLGGQIGWNGQQVFESDDLIDQIKQTLENIREILATAGAKPEHVVRLTWYVVDKKDYTARLREVGEAYRSVFGRHFPSMTMIQVADLVEDQAKVEIEATAVLPRAE